MRVYIGILIVMIVAANAQDTDPVWVGDLEHGPMPLTRANPESPWYEQGNLAEVVTAPEPVRHGTYAVKFFVDRINSPNSYRSMIIPKGTPYIWATEQDIGKHWWYGFSTWFPASWTSDNIWELVAQMHGRPDLDIGEDYRNPFLSWTIKSDNILKIHNIWDAKRNTHESGTRVYDGERDLWTGTVVTEEWTDWVMHTKWSYLGDGIMEIWRNGVQIVDFTGPNCFNDERGGYFDIGIYKDWKDRYDPVGIVSTRQVYFDEVRIAGGVDRYDDVAPPGSQTGIMAPPDTPLPGALSGKGVLSPGTISVFNLAGKLVMHKRLKSAGTFTVHNNGMAPGAYLLRVKTGKRSWSRMVIFIR